MTQKKFKKYRKGKKLSAIKTSQVLPVENHSSCQLVSLSYGRVKQTEILGIKTLLKKKMKKRGVYKIKIFAHHSLTKKPAGIRMGKGKGNIQTSFARVRPGTCICEVQTKHTFFAEKTLRNLQHILSLPTKIHI